MNASPDMRIEVFPGGRLDLFLGAKRVYSACLPEGVVEQHRQKRVEQRIGFGRSRIDGNAPFLAEGPIQGLRYLGQLGDFVSKVFAQRLLKRAVLALLVLALSCTLLGHGAKRNRNLRGAAA